MPEIFDPNRESEKADKLFTQEAMESLEMANEDLVKKIFRVSMNTLRTGDGHTRVSYTMANFAALLAALSRQAEESTKKIVRLTWALLLLTVALLVVSVFQIVIFKQDTAKNSHDNQTNENNKQIQTDTKPLQKVVPIPPVIKNEVHK